MEFAADAIAEAARGGEGEGGDKVLAEARWWKRCGRFGGGCCVCG